MKSLGMPRIGQFIGAAMFDLVSWQGVSSFSWAGRRALGGRHLRRICALASTRFGPQTEALYEGTNHEAIAKSLTPSTNRSGTAVRLPLTYLYRLAEDESDTLKCRRRCCRF